MAAKKVTKKVKIQLKAGRANPAPPVGTALGPTGINIQDFCAQFNDKTKDKGDTVIPVDISIYEDRTFSFVLKSPPAAVLICQKINIPKGSGVPNKTKVGTITWDQCKEIGNEKAEGLNAYDEDQRAKIIAGTARSMGVNVTGQPE